MKTLFISENGFVGKVNRDHPNMRTDVAWICATNADHTPITELKTIPSDSYDLGVVIIPKNKMHFIAHGRPDVHL